MIRKLIGACVGLAMIGLAGAVHGAIVTTPTSLNPGDQYHLAFLTSSARDALSSDVVDYNEFVEAAANSQAELAALGVNWTAIISTASVDARDNTNTNPTIDPIGFPIFLLNDTMLAADYSDLWDGSVLVPLNVLSSGQAAGSCTEVWTGTVANGVADPARPAGVGISEGTIAGFSSFTSDEWVFSTAPIGDQPLPLYGISDILTVVPIPAALPLMGTGLAVMGFLGWRRRRAMQLKAA